MKRGTVSIMKEAISPHIFAGRAKAAEVSRFHPAQSCRAARSRGTYGCEKQVCQGAFKKVGGKQSFSATEFRRLIA
uniref:Uncharacterized protein n=1 Tax=Ixodes ricinus TaxID=34613 RepID=A0A6B0TVV2_IXORI